MLTLEEKQKIVKRAYQKAKTLDIPVRWVKDTLHEIAETIQDAVDGTVKLTRIEVPGGAGVGFNVLVSDRIDVVATTHGLTFSNAEKKWLFAFVMELTFERDK